jgi:peptidyl-prolyl cis-trans isomerase SurA
MMKFNGLSKTVLFLAVSAAAVGAWAQAGDGAPASNLDIPANPEFLGGDDPTVRKATAIVNGDVITGTDVDHRLGLIILANGGAQNIPGDELQRLREQVLRNLVDETLQIQAAESKDIKVDQKEIDSYYERYARNLGRSPKDFAEYLRSNGSSENSIKRQIHGEIAWRRLQGREIEVNISDEEVRSVMERQIAAKGTQEYRVSEIFLSATSETAAEVQSNAQRIVQQIRNGASFIAYARQFSEASTAGVGGDLGWVRAEQLPEPLSQAVQVLPIGQVADPIQIPGGYSILQVQDTKKVLTADARDSILSLKQMSVSFQPTVSREEATAKVEELTRAGEAIAGCGAVEETAAKIGAEVVTSDNVRARELPAALQEMLLNMSIGRATRPFGSLEEGVRILVLCGRDDPEQVGGPDFEQIYAQLEEQRINLRARRYLRDLRRDAVVEYR